MPEQSQFFESIFNHVDSAIFVIDVTAQGKFIYVMSNRSHQQGLGVDKDFIKGKTPDDLAPLISQEYASTIKKNYQRCVKEKKPLQYDESFTVNDCKIWVNTRLIPLVNESGSVYRIIGISTHITDRKKAEKTLWNSEKRYRELVEKAGIAILMDDKDGNITYLNKKLAELFGYSSSELKNKSIQSLVHPDDIDRVMKFHKARLQGKRVPSKYEFKGIRKDGSLIYLEVAEVELHDETHQEGTRSYLWDITNRKRAEEEKEKSMHSLKERTKELNCLYNISKSILEQNPLEVVLQDVVECIPPGWQYPEITRAKIVFDGKEFVSEPFEETQWKLSNAITVDGTNRGSVDVYYVEEFPELDEGPFLKEERVLINGISEKIIGLIKRKEVEEALRLREQEIRTITDNVPALVSYVDKDGYYRFINKQYKEWFGIPKKEILAKHYTQVLGKVAQKRIKDHIKKALSGKQVSYEEKLPYKHGGARWVKADYVPDVDDQGDINGFFALVTDITDRKQAEKAIERHKQELQHLSSHLMHTQEEERQNISQELHDELGQMLTALSINLSSLDKLRTKEFDSQIRERLEESIQLVDTMSEQLNEMILNLRPSMLDDLGLIPTLRWYVKRFKDRNQIKVNLRITPSKQKLTKDIETVLYRIIQEALTNTAKHAQAENVQVSINRRKASLKVTIQDDGQGFDVKKVSSLPVHERGSGLTGMKERLLTVNGKLNISSKKDQGTRLDIIIPMEDNT